VMMNFSAEEKRSCTQRRPEGRTGVIKD